jgi:C4-dicarboxylate-specific signal transduction histidine kinase
MIFFSMISQGMKKVAAGITRMLRGNSPRQQATPKDVCEILDQALEKASFAIALSGCKIEKSLKKGFVIPEKEETLVNAFFDIINDCIKCMAANKGELCVAVFQHAGRMMVVIKDNVQTVEMPAGEAILDASFRNGPDGLPLELLHTRSLFSQFGGAMGVSTDPDNGRLFTIAFKRHYTCLN